MQIPAKQTFFGVEEFPFLSTLQNNWQVILDELHSLDQTYFMDWPERSIYCGKWSVFGLYAFGKKLSDHCRLCPRTTELVERIPGMTTAGFSAMAPDTYITPHVGYTDQVLRCHVGLITPKHCAIRVADQMCSWTEGSCFVFDDSCEHEAWNRSDSTRVVLLLDFLKPAAMPSADSATLPRRALNMLMR